jgi:hypothetical protein
MSVSCTPLTHSFHASGHVTTHSRKLPFLKAQTALLPNDGALPTASVLYQFLWGEFPSRMVFITKLGPQVSLLLYHFLVLTPAVYSGERLSAFIHWRFICIILSPVFILKSKLLKRKMKKGEFDDVFRYEQDDENWRPTYILP